MHATSRIHRMNPYRARARSAAVALALVHLTCGLGLCLHDVLADHHWIDACERPLSRDAATTLTAVHDHACVHHHTLADHDHIAFQAPLKFVSSTAAVVPSVAVLDVPDREAGPLPVTPDRAPGSHRPSTGAIRAPPVLHAT